MTGFDYSEAVSPIEEIIEDARNGRMFVLVDHEDRENEGDLIIPAQMATPDAINFMAKHARGLICLALTEARTDSLGLPLMAASNSSRHETAFTISIEAKQGVSTGISAHDRAHTVLVAINPETTADELATPGHVFPVRARNGGVLVRAGHTEAAVDIARLAGLNPSGVICEIMKDDGTMARLPDLIGFAQLHGLKVGTISDLIAYRLKYDNLVRQMQSRAVNSAFGGEWMLQIFEDEIQGSEHIVLSKGEISDGRPVLVRMHAINPLTDLLALTPGNPNQLADAMRVIAGEGRGVVVLLRDTHMKLDLGRGRSPQTLRQYGLGAQILATLGVRSLELLTNSPSPKIIGLDGYGLSVAGTRPIEAAG
ncbi:MAG: 3,4-dihydroxy-2-butanone-4-phosphate synthase [Rhodobacteraceae bacterium]|nr:3,4-dihydroxy-2-butanone-4-phosphate synthase [Paracoccaceae bacterium]